VASRDAILRALTELRTWFPTMPDSESLIDATRRGLEEYDDDEVRVAATRITRERKRLQGAPALADMREMCAAVAGVRRADAVRHQRADTSDAYCPFCGTTQLVESAPWPNGRRRDVPRHAWMGDRPCARADAEADVPAPVNMASWPSDRPKRGTAPGRGLAGIGAVVEEVTP
jgi:hypothetical protein